MNIIKATAFAGAASAWKSSGHLLVARIAYEILEKDSPSTITKVEDVLKILHSPSNAMKSCVTK